MQTEWGMVRTIAQLTKCRIYSSGRAREIRVDSRSALYLPRGKCYTYMFGFHFTDSFPLPSHVQAQHA